MVREITGVLFDVLDDVLEAVDGVAQQQQPFFRQPVAVVVELADVVLHRLRHLDALADTRGLGDAAQRVGWRGAALPSPDTEPRPPCIARCSRGRRRRDRRSPCGRCRAGPDRARPVRATRHSHHAWPPRPAAAHAESRPARRRCRCRNSFAPGQRVGAARDCAHVDRRLAAAFELVDELRHRGDGIAHDIHDLGRARQRLADDAIQDALDAPRELADAPRADHAAAALQRVEHPAHVAQRLRVQRIRLPLREQRLRAE